MWFEIGAGIFGSIVLPSIVYLFKRNLTLTSKITEYDIKIQALETGWKEHLHEDGEQHKDFYRRIEDGEKQQAVFNNQLSNNTGKFAQSIEHLDKTISELRKDLNTHKSDTIKLIREEMAATKTAIIERMDYMAGRHRRPTDQ